MTPIKRVSAGLIAMALLTTSATAHAAVPERHALRKDHVAHEMESHARMPVQADQPGGVCDHGDNPGVC